jgi:Flp pilus assembly protein CpaB
MSLSPRWWPASGWRRTVAVRRAVAAGLVLLAAVLALTSSVAPPGTPVLVAVHDLGPGAPVAREDLAVRLLPPGTVPVGALADPDAAAGRRLVGGVRAGETLTDVRLLGPAATVAAAGVPDAAGVPLRLADPAVAALLAPGTRVDVVGSPTPSPATGAAAPAGTDAAPAVLAGGAVVLAVLPSPDRTSGGPVVLVGLPAASAARVAGVSLAQEVTVTLR